MDKDEFIEQLNARLPRAMQTLRGRVAGLDQAQRRAMLDFTADDSMCNPGGGVQGGFICGMLDAAMAYAVFGMLGDYAIVASLEIKISYLEITRPGALQATGTVVRAGRTVTFLEAELHDSAGVLLANASSTARVIRKPPG